MNQHKEIKKWRDKHKLAAYIITALGLILLVVGGLYSVELGKKTASPLSEILKQGGEFVAHAAFVGLMIELFMLRLFHTHLVIDFIEAVKRPINIAVNKTSRIIRQIVKEEIKSNQEQLETLEQKIDSILSLSSNTMQRVEDSQEEVVSEIYQLRDFVEPRYQDSGVSRAFRELNIGKRLDEMHSGQIFYIKNTLCSDWREWVNNLKAAIERGVCVRLLIVKSNSKTAKCRAEQLCKTEPNFLKLLKEFSSAMYSLRDEFLKVGINHLEIQEFHEPANYPLFLVVNSRGKPIYAFASFYTDSLTEANFPHIEASGDLLQSFFIDVTAMWNRTINQTDRKKGA